jgi:hypothetical protein
MLVSGNRSVVDGEDGTVIVLVVTEALLLLGNGDEAALWMGWRLYTFRRSGPPQNSD